MKQLPFALLACGLFSLRAQAQIALPTQAQTTMPALPDTLRYQQVVAVAGTSAETLYARAREWAALTFEDVH